MLKRGRTHDGSITVPYKFSKEFPEFQLDSLIRFMQNPEDSLVRPDYELILCIDYLHKVNIWAFILKVFLSGSKGNTKAEIKNNFRQNYQWNT